MPKENPSKGFSLDSFGNKSTLFLVCTVLLVCKMSDDLPAEQQICDTLSAARHFCSAKILAGGLRWGTGVLIAEGEVPAQRNLQRKFALRRVGSHKFVVPPTTERSKVRRHAQPVQPSVPGSPGCQRGRAPLFPKESRGNPFKGFLWAISSRRLDTALLCAAKKRGVESPGWQASSSLSLALAATDGKSKKEGRLSPPKPLFHRGTMILIAL